AVVAGAPAATTFSRPTIAGWIRQWTRYVPGFAVTLTVKLSMGPANGPPLVTTADPSKTHGLTTVPQGGPAGGGAPGGTTPDGSRPAMLKLVCVVPFRFRAVSSVSGDPRPAVNMSARTVVAVGRIVAVWNPWMPKDTEVPVATVVVCGK